MKKRRARRTRDDQYEKCWTYIGRFLWHFGIIESWVNEIFPELYDLEQVAFLFIGQIDTLKKLRLIDAGLSEKGSEGQKSIISQVHVLHDLRNAIAHSSFFIAEGGMTLDHITHQGKRWRDKAGEFDNYISFSELDEYDEQSRKLIDALTDLHGTITPISSPSKEFRARVEEIIDASPNVIRYRPRTPKER